jgi:hypothetical protein
VTGNFDNGQAITFDASSLDAGEVFTFDARGYNTGAAVGASDAISVKGGAANDVFYTARLDEERGALTFDLSLTSGGADISGIDTIVIANDGWNGEGLVNVAGGSDESIETAGDWSSVATSTNHGVEVIGFKGGAGGDRLDVYYDSVTSMTSTFGFVEESYVLTTGDSLSGLASGAVIEISSGSLTLNSLGSSWTLKGIAESLSNRGDGDALVGLKDGEYTVVIYSSNNASTADAHLFNIRVDGGDGLDFTTAAGTGLNSQADNDMIEYVGVLRGVGADILTGENFI